MSDWDAIRGDAHSAEAGLTNRFAGGKVTRALKTEAEGPTTLATPAAGKQITLYWIALISSEKNAAEVLATVKLGETVVYEWYLGAPGAFMHWEPIEGAVGDKLTVTLSAAGQKVAVNFTYTESYPRS